MSQRMVRVRCVCCVFPSHDKFSDTAQKLTDEILYKAFNQTILVDKGILVCDQNKRTTIKVKSIAMRYHFMAMAIMVWIGKVFLVGF